MMSEHNGSGNHSTRKLRKGWNWVLTCLLYLRRLRSPKAEATTCSLPRCSHVYLEASDLPEAVLLSIPEIVLDLGRRRS